MFCSSSGSKNSDNAPRIITNVGFRFQWLRQWLRGSLYPSSLRYPTIGYLCRSMGTCRSLRARVFLALVACVGLTACGAGGGAGSNSGQTVNLAGFWQASTVSGLGFDTSLSGTIAQNGEQLSGTMNITGSPCAISGTLSGTISGSRVSLSLSEGQQSVSLSGTASADGSSISGTYQGQSGGCLSGDSGTFTATRSTSSNNPGCVPAPAGIVSWWRGENNALDQEGLNSGSLQGGVTFATGEVGQAFVLDGSTGYVNVPDSPSLQQISTAASVEMWTKPQLLPSGASAYLYSRRNPLTSEGFSVYILQDGTLGVLLRTTTSPTQTGSKFESAPGVIVFGQMQHLGVTANLTTSVISAYINGAGVPLNLVYGPATLGGSFSPVTNLYIGRREDASVEGTAGAAYFSGLLDEVSLYSTVLTQTQIASIVNAGSAGKCH